MHEELTDRELLELAAKAAGHDLQHTISAMYPYADVAIVNGKAWNPLTDDGDALRLAVALNISVTRPVVGDSVQHFGTYADDHAQEIHAIERDNGNACAATRRAIVRVAAEIGRAMT